MDCFAEPVIGRALRATRWLAMTMWRQSGATNQPDGQIKKSVQPSREKYSA